MIPILELVRLEENEQWGTFGVLKIQKEVFCVTLELPDRENVVDKSSIPAQQYMCNRIVSPKFGETFTITHVPGRTNVLIHSANVVDQLLGCIALAQFFGKLKGDRAILNSGETFKEFMRRMEGYNELHLTISECY